MAEMNWGNKRIVKEFQDSLAVGLNILSWRDLLRENKLNE